MLTRGFIKLLKRYREGTLPHSVKEAMDIWYHSLHKDPVEKNDKETIRERIWSGIAEGKERAESPFSSGRKKHWWKKGVWKVAAAILIVSGTAFYLSGNWLPEQKVLTDAVPDISTGWMETTNNGSYKKDIFLPDGSKVVLESGSTLRYPQHFDMDSRVVYLDGSGFFDVTKDSERPFLVYSGTVLTRVLGTSFSIKAIAETGGTEVAVVTGKVMVAKARPETQTGILTESENRIVLTPNKKVTFFNDSDHYVTGLVENPLIVANREEYLKPGAFNFDEAPLTEVLEKLEKAYGVEITLSNDSMLECPVTADLTSDSLYGKIEIIGAVLNAAYEITGSSILLSGGGCSPSTSKP